MSRTTTIFGGFSHWREGEPQPINLGDYRLTRPEVSRSCPSPEGGPASQYALVLAGWPRRCFERLGCGTTRGEGGQPTLQTFLFLRHPEIQSDVWTTPPKPVKLAVGWPRLAALSLPGWRSQRRFCRRESHHSVPLVPRHTGRPKRQPVPPRQRPLLLESARSAARVDQLVMQGPCPSIRP